MLKSFGKIDYANGEEIALCIKMGFAWKFQGKLNSIEEAKSGVIFIIIWYFLNITTDHILPERNLRHYLMTRYPLHSY